MKRLRIYVDGASRGNPGPASYGVVIQDEAGSLLRELGEAIGHATNSVAEYRALIRGLEEAHALGAQELDIYTDSQLVARQFEGLYRIKHPDMIALMSRVRALQNSFAQVRVTHIPRSSQPGNQRADQLANIALNKLAKPI